MAACRLFLTQDALERWIADGRAKIDGEDLTDTVTGNKFRLITGIHFLSEVTGQPDLAQLVGKVKDMEQVEALKAEHMRDSVILGDNAYSVVEGFVGTPVVQEIAPVAPKPRARAATIASLQAFFLNNVK